MYRDTLNAKYDADAQVKRLVRSMGKTFQKLSANKKFFHSSFGQKSAPNITSYWQVFDQI